MSKIDLALVKNIVNVLDDKLAKDIKVIKVGDFSVIADYFVIAEGNNITHVRAISEEVEFQLKQRNIYPLGVEGRRNDSWTVLDYNSVIVHIFYRETRAFYDLEKLWENGEEIDVNQFLTKE